MRGCYLRDDIARDPDKALAWMRAAGLDTAAVNVAHRDTLTALAQAKIDTWVFALPDLWMPTRWRTTLIRCVEAARSCKARGVLPDPEMGWSGADKSERLALRDTLAATVRGGTGVLVTTHDGLRRFARYLAGELGPLGVVGSPQVYDHQRGETLDRPARICTEWDAHGWAAVVPSVGSFGRDTESFRAYFAALPKDRGGLIWYAGDAPKGKRLDAIREWAA